MKVRIKFRQRLMPWIIILLLGLEYKDPRRAYTILLVAFGGMSAISYLWSQLLGRGIQLHRECHSSPVQAGNYMEEYLTLSNRSVLPAPSLELIDRSNLPDFNANRITSLGARTSDQWIAASFCAQRGLFHLGDAQITTTDLFGIFDVTIHAPLRTPILVLPQPSILPELVITPADKQGEGQPRRDVSQQGMHASSVRELAEGDSMRLIHWPTTARKNKPFVRLLEDAPEGKWWIMLDLDREYMHGNGWDSIEEQSIALAASLANLGLHIRKSTGLVSSGSECKWLPPKKGDAQLRQILLTLALAKPGTLPLTNLLDKMSAPLGNQHSLLIVTACTRIDWIQCLPMLIKQGLIPTIFLIDTSSFDGANSMEIAAMTLTKQNVRHRIIPRGLIKLPRPTELTSFDDAWNEEQLERATPF
jgi:uncharacterized protein (DUF58 family)